MSKQPDAYLALASEATVNGVIRYGVWGGRKSGHLLKVQPGALVALYVAGARMFAGTFEVMSGYYYDDSPLWVNEVYPHRVKLAGRVFYSDKKRWVDIVSLLPDLNFIKKPEVYGLYLRSSWSRIPGDDFVRIDRSLRRSTGP